MVELLDAVDGRPGDHGLDAVVEEQVGEQERQRDGVVAQVLERGPELPEALREDAALDVAPRAAAGGCAGRGTGSA